MSILKEIPELLHEGVITQQTADRIQDYYKSKKGSPTTKLFIVFGVLGAILVGLGIILIIAHNWDELTRTTKTIFAFLPLIIGQLLNGWVIIKKSESIAWRESVSVFLFFAIGASISLVSQIYNIPGNLSSFLLTWMLLCIPLIYLMKSSVSSLLCLAGITYYATQASYWIYPSSESYLYWVLFLLILPHYYQLYRNKPRSNFMIFHNWMIPLSLVITLGTLAGKYDELMYVAYMALFGILSLIGEKEFFSKQRTFSNGYRIIGSLGTIIVLLMLSFSWFWDHLRKTEDNLNELVRSAEFLSSIVLIALALVLLLYRKKEWRLDKINPFALIFLLFIPTYIIGLNSSTAIILINLFGLALSVLTILQGARKNHLGILNYGLLIITALVVCRFFDSDMSFVLRGVLFVLVGVGFFVSNYVMLKKRKSDE
ncbi:DUF2157 domain-containing protein [Carboxylicivirga linearis]|uniref:DUF2157 domain-containing protein n=1 Tax=Carboxylicivirga linearis TaxID=1628157 RepID=A0ABS5JR38_9BACT|nr:DUF2157 domain-containing protein [Carboxylicivirga linearis]MBS2097341.1 DUF2157 domain-containing protein [Carboxylicivirga linearis]